MGLSFRKSVRPFDNNRDPLPEAALCLWPGEVYINSLLHQRGSHHKDDKQHQHDIDQRGYVDLG